MTSTIRDILNAAKWRDQDLQRLSLTVTHRGAPGDVRSVEASAITEIKGNGVEVRSASTGELTWLPYHRVEHIVRDDGALVWSRAEGVCATPDASPASAEPKPQANDAAALRAALPWKKVESDLDVTLPGDELTLDGSAGEGGGQMLRSSLTLSMLTGRPFILENIRAGRKKPGLMRQHLTCVRAAAEICGAVTEGASLRSTRLSFRPGAIRAGSYRFDIGSAGSVGLVLHTLALPLALVKEPSSIEIHGGTHVKWAPPVPFLETAWWPLMERMGFVGDLRSTRAGFYPAGGGHLELRLEPMAALQPLHLVAAPPEKLRAHAIVANLPEGIARREVQTLVEALNGEVQPTAGTVRGPGPGNACWLAAESPGVTNVFSAFGERGTSAEDVATEVAEAFSAWRGLDVAVCEHLSDQLMLPLVFAGGGSYTSGELTLHTRTNREVIRAFLDVAIDFETDGTRHRVRVGESSGMKGD